MWRKWTVLKRVTLTNEPDWVSIHQSTDEYSMRIFKLKLEDHEIPAIIFDQRDSSYNAFGYLYLQVKSIDRDKAINLLDLQHE